MKKTGYSLLTIGFLAGALIAVVDVSQVRWVYFLGSLLTGFSGVVMVRHATQWKSRAEEQLAAQVEDLKDSLGRIVEKLADVRVARASTPPKDVRDRIDHLFPEDLATFVEARRSLAHIHGLQLYADVMSHFAAGERYLNRVWSASADGYVDEVTAYLEKAESQFTKALQKVRQVAT